MVWNPSACSKTHRSMKPWWDPRHLLDGSLCKLMLLASAFIAVKSLPHLEYSNKRFVARAADFPVAYDQNKRLAVSAVEFPLVLANLEVKPDALHSQFERLTIASERLAEVLGKVVNLEENQLQLI